MQLNKECFCSFLFTVLYHITFMFCFMKRTYWCGQPVNQAEMVQLNDSDDKRAEYIETDPDDLTPGIQIQGLTKVLEFKLVLIEEFVNNFVKVMKKRNFLCRYMIPFVNQL